MLTWVVCTCHCHEDVLYEWVHSLEVVLVEDVMVVASSPYRSFELAVHLEVKD